MEDRNLIVQFLQEVEESICPILQREVCRFRNNDKLLKKYINEKTAWEKNSNPSIDGIMATVNEMCFAKKLLLMGNNKECLYIDYERPITGTHQTIDFFVQTKNDKEIYFDVKTVQPKETDAWEKYEKATQNAYFPNNTELVLDQDSEGGNIYHDYSSARGRFLEYTIEFEEKIKHIPNPAQYQFIMVFCGDGFTWRQDHLEEFADFYRTQEHRPDDKFAKMETHYMNSQKITLTRKICSFGYLEREKSSVDPTKLNLHVYGPRFPW